MVIRHFAAGCLAVLLSACPGYSPEFVDCKVKCSAKGTCPAGRECKQGFCRPPMVATSCECTAGDQRPCGGGAGLCNPGVQTCTNSGSWGVCVGEGKPNMEICDNKDNDCNGLTDDSPSDAPPCPKSKGVCLGVNQVCTGGAYPGSCDAADYGPSYEAIETRCDNLDNDCNGVVDATASAPLMTGVSDFVLAEFDGGFSLVVVEDAPAGGYQVVLLRLDPALQPRGAPVPVSPPALANPQDIAARATPGGTTFIAWGDSLVDAGVQLSAVDSNGIVSTFPPYPASERTGKLSLGVNATKVMVTWPAHFTRVARLVTWDLLDGGIATRNFWTLPDGGPNALKEISASRLSPTGKVIGFRGYDNDGGGSFTQTVELQGARLGTGLGGRFQFTEVGNLVQSGWNYSFTGFFPIFQPESGFEFKNDVFASPLAALKKQNDQNITIGAIGRGQNTTVAMWTERNQLGMLATPFGNGSQARVRAVFTDGGYFGEVALGHPGGSGGLLGLVWRDTLSGSGNLTGMMICQP